MNCKCTHMHTNSASGYLTFFSLLQFLLLLFPPPPKLLLSKLLPVQPCFMLKLSATIQITTKSPHVYYSRLAHNQSKFHLSATSFLLFSSSSSSKPSSLSVSIRPSLLSYTLHTLRGADGITYLVLVLLTVPQLV